MKVTSVAPSFIEAKSICPLLGCLADASRRSLAHPSSDGIFRKRRHGVQPLWFSGLSALQVGEVKNFLRPNVPRYADQAFAALDNDALEPLRNRSIASNGFHVVVIDAGR